MLVTRRRTKRRSAFSGYNRRKKQALQIFWERGWLNPATFAAFAGMRPIRGVYSYLRRLHAWGLLERSHSPRGLILYRLSEKGEGRLAWLGGPANPLLRSNKEKVPASRIGGKGKQTVVSAAR